MKITILLFLFAFSFSIYAQTDTLNIKKQADSLATALLNHNYDILMDFTYPKIIEEMGGDSAAIKLIKDGIEDMQKQGISIFSVYIDYPRQVVQAGKEIHSTVSQTVVLKVPDGKLKTVSTLLAISKDNGKHWYYIDAGSMNSEQLKEYLPNFNPDLIISEISQPVFIPD